MSMKIAMYMGGISLSSLGFYRGCKEYVISKTKSELEMKDYMYGSIFGLIGASTYVNPAFLPFVIHDEFMSETNNKSTFLNLNYGK